MTKTTVTTNNMAAVLRFAIRDPSDFDLGLFFVVFGSEQRYATTQYCHQSPGSLLKTEKLLIVTTTTTMMMTTIMIMMTTTTMMMMMMMIIIIITRNMGQSPT